MENGLHLFGSDVVESTRLLLYAQALVRDSSDYPAIVEAYLRAMDLMLETALQCEYSHTTQHYPTEKKSADELVYGYFARRLYWLRNSFGVDISMCEGDIKLVDKAVKAFSGSDRDKLRQKWVEKLGDVAVRLEQTLSPCFSKVTWVEEMKGF